MRVQLLDRRRKLPDTVVGSQEIRCLEDAAVVKIGEFVVGDAPAWFTKKYPKKTDKLLANLKIAMAHDADQRGSEARG